jgi:hypothetical protein
MYKNSFLIFFLFLINVTCFSQGSFNSEVYPWYDEQTGIENSSLFRGIEYIEEHRMINEKHKFFESDKFQKGNVIYDGQVFNNVTLRFNVYDDVLIVNIQQKKRNSFFQLISDKVNSFQINNHEFRYLDPIDNSNVQGFYEVISEEKGLKIFKKHIKKKNEQNDKSIVYFEFTTKNPDYFFQFDGKFYELNNKRDLISKFPNYKKEIKDFYKDYRGQSRNSPDTFMKNLSKEINLLINNKTI